MLVCNNLYLDTLFVLLACLVAKIWQNKRMAAILDAILNSRVSTAGIAGDFWYVFYNIFMHLSWKNQLVTNFFQVEPIALGLKIEEKNTSSGKLVQPFQIW